VSYFRVLTISIALLAVNGCATLSHYEASEFDIQFGILTGDCKCDMEVETTKSIPYVIGKEKLKFGYHFRPKTDDKYKFRAVLYIPQKPLSVSGTVVNTASEVMEQGLKTKEVICQGPNSVVSWLDFGDPKGTYRLALYINDHLAADTSFEVK
jgi:hypothetical protein